MTTSSSASAAQRSLDSAKSSDAGLRYDSTVTRKEVGGDECINDRENGWIELMGKDIMMKPIDHPSKEDDRNNDMVNAYFLPCGKRCCEKSHAEVRDAVLIDFEGYCPSSQSISTSELLNNIMVPKDEAKEKLTVPAPFQRADGWTVILGEGDVVPGLEMAIRHLSVSKSALIRCHSKFAYGLSGRQFESGVGVGYAVPPEAETVYHLNVRGVLPADELNKDSSFRIGCARQKKSIGNDCYKFEWGDDSTGGAGKWRALKAYNAGKVLMTELIQEIDRKEGNHSPVVSSSSLSSTEIRKEAMEILVDCLNNIAAVHMRSKSYSSAKEAAAQAIQYDGNNIKALCRAAKASMLDPAVTFEESDLAIKCAEEIDCRNKEVRTLRAELGRRMKEYRQREKEMYTKMMRSSKCSDRVNVETHVSEDLCPRNESLLGFKTSYLVPFSLVIILLLLAFYCYPMYQQSSSAKVEL